MFKHLLGFSFLLILVFTGLDSHGQACTPTYTTGCNVGDQIQNFSTTGGTTNITNLNSGCNGTAPTFLTYFNQTVGQIQGLSFNFTVQAGATWSQGFRIFIDWNQDLDFLDPGEDVWNSGGSGTTPFTGSVTIPFTATPGTCRMRVICQFVAVPAGPCISTTWGEAEEYNVQVIPATPCTTVNGGTAVAMPVSPCPGTTFNLNLTGNTLASGLSYLWLQSIGGPTGPWDTLSPSVTTQSTNIPAPAQQTWYSCVVTCGPTTNFDTSAAVSVTAQPWSPWSPCYCYTSTATSAFDTDIGQVIFGTLNNPSVTPTPQNNQPLANRLYSNYDTLVPIPNYLKGQAYPLSVYQISSGGTMFNSWAKVFIDYNHNTVFDPTEEIFSLASNAGNGYNPSNAGVVIPTTALTGLTRMRVVLREGGSQTSTIPCGPYTWGETEDYVINILDPGPHDPAITNIQVFPPGGCMDSCENVIVTLSNFGSTVLDLSINPVIIKLDVDGPLGVTSYIDTANVGFLQPYNANNSFFVFPCVNFYEGGCYNLNTDTLAIIGSANTNLVNDTLFTPLQVCNSRPNSVDYNLCLGDTIPTGLGLGIVNCPTGLVQDSVLVPFTLSFAGTTPGSPTQCAAIGAGNFAAGTLPTLPPGANILSGEISADRLQLAPLTFTTGPNLTRLSLYQGALPTTAANVYHSGLQGNPLTALAFGCFNYLSNPSAADLNTMYVSGVPVNPAINMGHWSTNRCTAPNILVNCGGTTTVYLKLIYEYIPMGISWYEQPSGGIRISDSSFLDPLTTANSIVNNSNNIGTYTFYGACAADTNCRVEVDLIINGLTRDSIIVNDVVCNGDSSGSISAYVSGGTPGYQYYLSQGVTIIDSNTTGIFGNLPAGIYSINVNDTVGCGAGDTSVTITEPLALVIDSIVSTSPTCTPGGDGTMTAYAQGGSGSLQYNNGGPNQSSNVWPNQVSNTYLVTVTDSLGCIDTGSHTIIAPVGPQWNVVTFDTVQCYGDSTGTITLSTIGGTSSSILDSIVSPAAWVQQITGGNVSGLPAGTYTLRATDGNNCSIDTMVTIASPSQLQWTSAVVDSVDCSGDTTGSITVTSTGGAGSTHTYSIAPNIGTQSPAGTFSGLSAQSYTVQLTDSNSCTLDTILTVLEPIALSIDTISVTQVGCNGDSSGILVMMSTGGTGTLSYSISPIVGTQGPSGTFSGLPANTYTIVGTDQNGCSASMSVTLAQPVLFSITSAVVDSVDCNGDTTGSATITLSGGTPSYSCTISPNVGSQTTSGQFSGLPAGTYTINCSDANNCMVSTMVTILEPSALSYTSVTSTNVSCNGAADGGIVSAGTGGTGTLIFGLSPTATQAPSGTFSGLSGGPHTITLSDQNACSLDSVVTILEPNILVIDTSSVTQVACNGDTSGVIVLTSSGGTPLVTYSISPSATQGPSGTFTGLVAGVYTITGTDANSCTALTTVTITQPTAVLITNVTSTVPSCVPGNDATLTITASGGTGTLNYNNGLLVSPGQLSNVFTNQGAGSYLVTVTDQNGCNDTLTHVITTPGAPSWNTITATPVLCNGDSNGTITLTTTGGTGTITYTITGPSNPVSNTTGLFTNLLAGNYALTAVDQNNCSITSSVIVTTPGVLQYVSIVIDSVDCTGGSDGSITVSGTGGITPYSYSITSPGVVGPNSTGSFPSLGANTYTVQVIDSNNCMYDTNLVVSEPVLFTVSSSSSTNILCNGDSTGVIVIMSTGGTGTPTYTISPNLGVQGPSGNFSGLPAGLYTISGSDGNNCTATTQVTLSEPTLLVIDSIVSSIPSCVPGNDATLTVYASGGATTYQYNNGGPNQLSNIFLNQGAGNYTVTVTDGNGCIVTSSHTIATPGAPTWSSVTSTNVNCNGDSTGSISAVVTPGNDPNITTTIILPIAWSPTSIPAINLPAAAYTIQAADGNGCSITSIVNITEPPLLAINTTVVDSVVCHGDTTGSITVTMTGGTPAYTYTINPNSGSQQTPGVFSGLPQGIYTISITDANSCTSSTALVVNEPAALSYTSVTSTNVSCNGVADGGIVATGTGGAGSLNYSLVPSGTQAPPGTFSGLSGGTHTITLSDANACTLDSVVNIIEPNVFSIDTNSSLQVLCFGDSSGQLVLSSTGGTSVTPVTYVLSPVNGSTSGPNGTFSNLPADTYTITATDNNGCLSIQTYTITQPSTAVSITNISGTTPSCVPGNDGTITVTASGGTGTLQYSAPPLVPVQTSNVLSSLGGGGYLVTVTDINGCTDTMTYNLFNSNAPSFTSVTSTMNLCNGDSTGTISGAAVGGQGTITYAIVPANGTQPTAGNFINLPAAAYSISATDANNCSVVSAINVNEPTVITFTSVVTDSVDCTGGTDGSITVTSSGGTGTLTYSINPIATQAPIGTFTSLAAMNYIVTITDSNACMMDSSIVVSEPASLVIDTTSLTTVLCRGDSTGQIIMTSTGGTGTVTYVATPYAGTQVGGSFSDLPAGTYTITATDGNSCVTAGTYTITEPATNVLINMITGTTPSCNPGGDGTVMVTAGGGTGSLSYLLNPGSPLPQTASSFTGLNSNTYLVTATDQNGCTDTMSYMLGASPLPTWGVVTSTAALCNGDSTGSITTPAVGGTVPLSYSIISPTSFIQTNGTGSFTNLPANTYTVEASDASNCSISTNVTVSEPMALSFISIVTDSVSCNGGNNGNIVVSGAGGLTPYSYTIAPVAIQLPVGTFINLLANTYTIQLTDSNGCTITGQTTVYEPTQIIVDSTSSIDVLCNGDSTGSLYVQSSGGTGVISYSLVQAPWNTTGASNGVFSGLAASTYTVVSTDVNNCTATAIVSITEPTPLTHSVSGTDVLCNGDTTGTITLSGSGGIGPYGYSLTPNVGSQQTAGNFSGLAAGNYIGVVTDNNACTDTTATIVISEPAQLVFGTATTQDIDCFGASTGSIGIAATGGTGVKNIELTGAVTQGPFPSPANFSNLPAGTYTLTVTDGNNCVATTTVTLTQNPQIFFSSITNKEEICYGDGTAEITFQGAGGVGGFTYVFNNGNPPGSGTPSAQTTYVGLAAGSYNIEAIDALGCRYDSSYTLLGPDPITWPTFDITPTTCLDTEDGKLTVIATGGRGSVYTYSLEPGFYVNTNGLFRDLAPRQYTLRTTDTAGCFVDTIFSIPLPSDPMVVSITKEDLGCHGRGNEGKAEAIVTGGTPPYTYLWSSTPVQITPRVTGLYQGYHTVEVVDARGCLERDTIVIAPGPCCQEVFLPNAFSPNGDGRNDEFRILSTAGMELQQFEVRNRWGIKIWESQNVRTSWDGTYGGKPVDVGTYYYVMRYKCLTDGQNYTMKGDVIVVR